MLKLPVSRMEELFSLISGERAFYLPIEANGLLQFARWEPGAAVRFDRLNTAKSPKDFFFPQTESLASFKMKGKEITIEEKRDPAGPFAVFGVRACDAESLNILDRVFLGDPVDTFYQERRAYGVVISAACAAPEETCFCCVFGIDPAAPGGDVATWITGDTLYWKSRTEKGNALTEKVKDLFTTADDKDEKVLAEQRSKSKAIFDKLPLNGLSLEGFTGESLMDKFNAPQWQELYRACLGCGTCTFVCPTCHCYDIQDFDTGRGVKRFRCWDSCMYSDFTMMAHGNPRVSQLERFRQRFMHKLVYFPENNEGVYACVGCGRCVAKCPVSLNIVKVIKALGVDNNARL